MTLKWRVVLVLILLSYVCLAALHLHATPIAHDSTSNYINAPDEAAHLQYVRALALTGHPPVRGDKDYPTYEWHQPPLYYLLARTVYGAGPYAIRWLGILLGTFSLLIVFQAARYAIPDDPPASVLATGFAALLPMRHAITSSIGNDVLVETLFGLFLLLVLYSIRSGFSHRKAIALGLTLGITLLTKATGALLVPVFIVSLFILWKQGEARRTVALHGAMSLLIAAALVFPWYARNYRLYNEITPARLFLQEFQTTKKASDIIGHHAFTADWWTGDLVESQEVPVSEYIETVANWTFRTFFAAYSPPQYAHIGLPAFMPPVYYVPYAAIGALSVAGLIGLHRRRKSEFEPPQLAFISILFVTFILVVAGFIGFNCTFFQTQGRYVYPALLPVSLLFAIGLRGAISPHRRDAAVIGVLLLFFVLAIAFYAAGVQPAYT